MIQFKPPYATTRQSLLVLFARWASSMKKFLDYSKYPSLIEDELEEQIIRGTGPASKTHNCVQLRHLPTGIVVKCYDHRETHKNQQLARQRLLEKLDDYLNGENSLSAQIARMEKEKSKIREEKAAELRKMKRIFKEKVNSEKANKDALKDS